MKVLWVHPHADNPNVASCRVNARIPAYLINRHKTAMETAVAKRVPEHFQPDVIICMSADECERLIKENPKARVIVFQSDGPKASDWAMERVSAIVVDSEFLATTIPAQHLNKTFYIPDSLEASEYSKPHTHPGRKLKLVWIGAGGNYFFAQQIVSALKAHGWDVTLITDTQCSESPIVPWKMDTLQADIDSCDVGIVPFPVNLDVRDVRTYDGFRYKDNNRGALMQACGLPIVCSPHPAYLLAVSHNLDGLLANTVDEWLSCLNYLQNSPADYNRLAINGHRTSWSIASPESVRLQWEHVIRSAS